ncbi:MAG TPA: ABC transporter permease [Planctomycetaceae bacterium]|nr:ABC transporter permease [Planctomycetaceae bacterium]
MLIGPVFTRELAIAPRRRRLYVARAAYALVLLVLLSTAWLVLTGTQRVRDIGDVARFGMIAFQILAPLQLALAAFFSALLAASAVAQEKDRQTLVLLLMTNLTNSELVLGKLLASLLNVLVLLAASFPVFMLMALLGGVSFSQIGRAFAVTTAAVLVCGSLGSTIALWREKTFQALAVTVLVLVLWVGVWEIVASGALGTGWLGLRCETWAAAFSPWQAIMEATRPLAGARSPLGGWATPVNLFGLVSLGLAVALNGVAVARVRVWNPSREVQRQEREEGPQESIWGVEHDLTEAGRPEGTERAVPEGAGLGSARPDRTRHVWDNPILWREIRTWAYGRKVLVVRLAYFALFLLSAGSLAWMVHSGEPITLARGAMACVPLFFLSLVLVNAQAVTSLTTERDGRALDLLLVSDLTPREFVFGKLWGAFYNTKEMVVLPLLVCFYLWHVEVIGLENLIYLVVSLGVLYFFSAMLGIHAGMHYANSRSAIATSLGTMFFLFVGVATCIRIMLAFSESFQTQLQPFLAFMVGGGVGLYLALGARNPSAAIGVASFACPLATFYAITSLFLHQPHLVFVATVAAYGFTTVAMLIPAIDEFDVATGRTTIGE